MSYLLIDDNGEHSYFKERPENSDFLLAVIKIDVRPSDIVDEWEPELSVLNKNGEFERINEEEPEAIVVGYKRTIFSNIKELEGILFRPFLIEKDYKLIRLMSDDILSESPVYGDSRFGVYKEQGVDTYFLDAIYGNHVINLRTKSSSFNGCETIEKYMSKLNKGMEFLFGKLKRKEIAIGE